MTTIYYTASSLNGFIADADNGLDWLFQHDVDGSGPMGYDVFFPRVGAILVGSTTYDWVHDREGRWPFAPPTWVLSSRTLRPGGERSQVAVTRGPVAPAHAAAVEAAGGRDVWVMGGGALAGQVADAGLLDEVWVQFAPSALVGGGAPLLPRDLDLRLEDVARNRDFVCVRWSVPRSGAGATAGLDEIG